VLFVNGSTLTKATDHPMVALYRNDGGRFTDVTAAAGLTRPGWGSGVCVADYDNDGFEDVYVTAYGPNVLWRNIDGRSFVATTQARDPDGAPAAHSAITIATATSICSWSTSSGSCLARCRRAASGHSAGSRTSTCSAARVVCPARPDALYRNEGNGTFVDVTKATNIVDPGYYGFGVLFSDLDDDGGRTSTSPTIRHRICSSRTGATGRSASARCNQAWR
jgi:hypothetical protein